MTKWFCAAMRFLVFRCRDQILMDAKARLIIRNRLILRDPGVSLPQLESALAQFRDRNVP
jgi:hypothetical protein